LAPRICENEIFTPASRFGVPKRASRASGRARNDRGRVVFMTMPAGTSSAEDPELAKRTATANELATECDRLRTTRDLLTTHLSRLSPPGLENANGGLNTSFNTDTHDNASTVFDDEMSETASMFSHATAQTAVTSASRGGSRFGGKSLGGASRKSRRSRKKNAKNNATGGDALAKLSPREKRVLANTELEYLEKALANDQMEGGKRVDSLRAKVEETELRLAATSKAFFEFSREVLGHAGGGGGGSGNSFQSTSSGGGRLNTHARTRDDGGHVPTTKNTRPGGSSVVSAEKWQRHLDSLIASKKANAGQFRLKTASAKVQVRMAGLGFAVQGFVLAFPKSNDCAPYDKTDTFFSNRR